MRLSNKTIGRFTVNINQAIENIEKGSDLIYTILQLENEICYREAEILADLHTVIINHEVPIGYHILKFYDSKGHGFEGGKTPHGYSITS